MNIAGLQKVSLIDYPGLISTVLFTPGCSFRCRFCHNPFLVIPPYQADVDEDNVMTYLEERRGLLQGVVITGGEPLIHPDLREFLTKVKALGYKVKLDTNGYQPQKLRSILTAGLLDYIAMDIKAPLEKYGAITQQPNLDLNKLRESIEIIMESDLPYEFRTTLIENFHDLDDIRTMSELISGADLYVLQKFVPQPKLVDVDYSHRETTPEIFLIQSHKIASYYVTKCQVR